MRKLKENGNSGKSKDNLKSHRKTRKIPKAIFTFNLLLSMRRFLPFPKFFFSGACYAATGAVAFHLTEKNENASGNQLLRQKVET